MIYGVFRPWLTKWVTLSRYSPGDSSKNPTTRQHTRTCAKFWSTAPCNILVRDEMYFVVLGWL